MSRHFTFDGTTAVCDKGWDLPPVLGLDLTDNIAHISCVSCWANVPGYARFTSGYGNQPCPPGCPEPHYVVAGAGAMGDWADNRCCPDVGEAARALCGCRG